MNTFTGKITAADSLFAYFDGKTNAYHTDDNFVPKFDYNCPAANQQRAQDLCGDNKPCLFDYCITLDEDIAMNTLSVYTNFMNTVATLGSLFYAYMTLTTKIVKTIIVVPEN